MFCGDFMNTGKYGKIHGLYFEGKCVSMNNPNVPERFKTYLPAESAKIPVDIF